MENDRLKQIGFSRVDIERDLYNLYKWLGDPDVLLWYREAEHSQEHYREHFAPEPTIHKFIILIDDVPVGYLQAFRLSDEPEYAAQLGLEHDAVAMDLFIGEPDYRGNGWGSDVLKTALDQIVFGELEAEHAVIAPDPGNTRAVRSYEQAGFSGDRIVWIHDDKPHNTGYERVLLISRDDFYGSTS